MSKPFILISNDDGVHAEGLRSLAAALRELGRVVIVAPDREQSAASHALTLHRPLRVRRLSEDVYAVEGTPTDCVLMAVRSLLDDRPDVVVSGINDGPNMGDDVNYSGTVAAAMEGSLLGIPALAFSIGKEAERDFTAAAHIAARLTETVLERQPPAPPEDQQLIVETAEAAAQYGIVLDGAGGENSVGGGVAPGDEAHGGVAEASAMAPRREDRVVLNVNIPGCPAAQIGPVRLTRLGKRFYRDAIVEKTDPRGERYYWIGGDAPTWLVENEDGIMTDFTAVARRQVSVTPLRLDWTDYEGLRRLASWQLGS